MRKTAKRFLGAFMAVALVVPTVNVFSGITGSSIIAQETTVEAAKVSEGFTFQVPEAAFAEGSGIQQICLQRSGDVSKASSVTISAYNFSAEYGKDYLIYADDKPLYTDEGTSSLYNQFRDNSYVVEREEVDNSMIAGLLEVQTMMANDEVSVVSEDDEPEYNEEFFLVLKSKDSLGENDLISVTIEDNEVNRTVNMISFSESQLYVDEESQKAEISFTRSGNLAAMSTILLCKNEQPYGYVTFNPYQDTQIVEAEAGVYQIANPENCQVVEPSMLTISSVSEEAVTTEADVTGMITSAAADSDVAEDLDAVPEYSAVESSTAGSNITTVKGYPVWFPDWAKNTSTVEDEDYIIYMGSPQNELFKQGGTKKNGKAKYAS